MRHQGGVAAGQASCDLVECAVAAKCDHQFDTAGGRVFSEARGMTAFVGLDDLHAVVASQVLVHCNGISWINRRCERVHNKQDLQDH
jgi:hypothetical protein